MNAATSTSASDAPSHSERSASYSTRYFAATYFDGDQLLDGSRHRTFRARRMQRARRIALGFMPPDADRMELVEINGHEFDQRRHERKAALADRSQNAGFPLSLGGEAE